jgi:broad-specificity NMP kinase
MPLPNIVVTGTPGTGKTTFSQLLLATLPEGFQHVNIGDVVKREKAYSGWNDEWDCWDVDEDKVRVCTLFESRVRALLSYTSLLGHVPRSQLLARFVLTLSSSPRLPTAAGRARAALPGSG